MPEQDAKSEIQTQSQISDDTLELSSFTQNIASLERIVSRSETELFGPNPNVERLSIYQSEAQSLLGELKAQQARAMALKGPDDPNVRRLQNLIEGRLLKLADKAEEIVRGTQIKIVALGEQHAALDAALSATAGLGDYDVGLSPSSLRVEENSQQYLPRKDVEQPMSAISSSNTELLSSAAGALADATKRLNELIDAHPEIRDDALPVLKQLVELSIRAILQRSSEGGSPPHVPVDTPAKRGDDDDMEPRVANLEKFADEARKELRSIDVRLAKIETTSEGLAKNSATKADVAQLEATLLKWFIGTAVALTALAFSAAKFFH